MTISEYLEENSLLTSIQVIDCDQRPMVNQIAIIGFADELERENVQLDIEARTTANVVQALFAATGQNLVELVPFSLADDLYSHPVRIQDPHELFFELGRLYFPGLLVY